MGETGLTIIGFSVIFVATTLGAALVFFFKNELSARLESLFFGFAAGVMLAASVWSLLIPAIEESAGWGDFSFVPSYDDAEPQQKTERKVREVKRQFKDKEDVF